MKKLRKTQVLKAVKATALLRNKLLEDEARPRYHFATPGDFGYPGDANMAFFANGRYHLMYLYKNLNEGNYCMGHLSSRDMLHWRMHPDALYPDSFDGGIFSGGAFVDDDGTVYVAYWALPKANDPSDKTAGIRIAMSSDGKNDYEKWQKFPEYAVRAGTEVGITEVTDEHGNIIDYLGCTDPSNIWKIDDTYYMQLGALIVLNKFRNDTNAPARMLGDWTEYYCSKDLHSWTHLGRFYHRNQNDIWTDKSEDDMCPSFLPLPGSANGGSFSGKYLQLFIAHNKGAQYYIGSYDPIKTDAPFTIEKHGRMSWQDNSFFAPEALTDPKGRQIMWAWLRDDRLEGEANLIADGYNGVFSLPRTLWLNENGDLGIAPVQELRNLRYNQTDDLNQINARSCEILLTARVATCSKVGLRINLSKKEYVDVYFDQKSNALVYDATHAVQGYDVKPIERAPLELGADEKLQLNIFIDRCVIEVFANERQAICRRSYTKLLPAYSVQLIGAKPENVDLTAWNIDETNLF